MLRIREFVKKLGSKTFQKINHLSTFFLTFLCKYLFSQERTINKLFYYRIHVCLAINVETYLTSKK